MKNIFLFLFIFCSFFLNAQYPSAGTKIRLGWQTTGDGLVWRGSLSDTSTIDPSTVNNAWILIDTVNGTMYAYRQKAWRLVSGGGGVSMPFDSVTFNINEGDASEQELKYSAEKGYLQYGGQDSVQIPILPGIWYVRNDDSVTVSKGMVVRASGTLGASGRIKVKRMIADGSIPAMYVLGIAMHDIAVGADGYIMSQGKIRNVNTEAYSDGAVLYADVDTLGGLTQTEPGNGYLKLPIAFVVHSASNGTLAVRVTTGSYLRDLHDVDTTGRVNGSVLRYDSTAGYWKASTTAGIVAGDTSVFARDFQLGGTTNYLQKSTGTGTIGNSKLYENPSGSFAGYVGWNTTTVNNKFQIGSVGSTGYAGNDFVIGNGSQVMAIEQTSTDTRISTNTNFSFMPAGVGATGNVGIGTTSPAERLSVLRYNSGTTNAGVVSSFLGNSVYSTIGHWSGIALGTTLKKAGLFAYDGYNNYSRVDMIFAVASGGNYDDVTLTDEKMRITNAGRVGIGTTTPTAGLDVQKSDTYSYISGMSARFADGVNSALYISHTSATGPVYTTRLTSSDDLAFGQTTSAAGTVEFMRIKATTGRVGIGTSSPSRSLHISATDAVRIPVGTDLGGVSANGDIRFNTTANNFEWYSTTSGAWRKPVISASATGLGTDGRVFYANANGLAAADDELRWDYTNNRLGIGITPTAPLHVSGGGLFTQTVQALNFTGASIANGTTANNVFSISGNTASTGNTATNANITFDVGNSAGTRAMTILNNGRVGIGTASPDSTLTVSTGIRATNIAVRNALNQVSFFNNYGPANSDGNNIWIGNGGQKSIYDGAFSIFSGEGNVSIGANALLNNEKGHGNMAIGLSALQANVNGSVNVAIGGAALSANQNGVGNMAIGGLALQQGASGSDNVAIGYATLNNLAASNNVAIGAAAQYSKTSGDADVAIGWYAGRYQTATFGATVTNSSQSIYIGAAAYPGKNNAFNTIVIGTGAVGKGDSTTTIGNSGVKATYIPAGKMYIGGTTSPGATLHVNGSLSRNAPVIATADTFTVSETHSWIICDRSGTMVLKLPAAGTWTGREIMVKTITANTVTSADTNVSPLDGGAIAKAILPATDGAWATLVSDGTNWIIMQRGS